MLELIRAIVTQNFATVLVASFALGVIVGVVFFLAVFRRGRTRDPLTSPRISDMEKRLFRQSVGIIDHRMTDKSLTIREAAGELNISPQTLNRIFRRCTGQDFNTCLVRSRLEVVKERMRSSNCPIDTVSSSCGFRSTLEMVRYFRRYLRTTPEKYRMEQQVT